MKRREFVRLVGGALAIAPSIARAQSGKRIPTVGYLWHGGSAKEEYPYYDAVIEGFARLGYVSGRNIVLEHRFPDEKPERFARMAAELVAIRPNVLMSGQVAVGYLQAATKTIPIVFSFVPDPVRMKLVASLARPGGKRSDQTFPSTCHCVRGKLISPLKSTRPRRQSKARHRIAWQARHSPGHPP